MTINQLYYKWLCDMVYSETYTNIRYRKLLQKLFKTPFVVVLEKDGNRAEDGAYLRYRFSVDTGYDEKQIDIGKSNVLEVLIGLSLRCEEDIMGDDNSGNRVGLWFWEMITNIGLSEFDDRNFDEENVDIYLEKFMYRNYDRDGTGCAFRINRPINLKNVELWYQLQYYIMEAYYDQ